MKFVDISACIGEAAVNRLITNHENYPVFEKVLQPKNALELLEEMDFNGIDEAVTYHQTMIDVAPIWGNEYYLKSTENYTGRLHGTLMILPSITEPQFAVEQLEQYINKYNIFGLRAKPKWNRYFLDAVTCGDLLQFCIEKNIPLYLSPDEGWEHIFEVMKAFPQLTVIITNYGLWGSDRYFYPLIKSYENVHIDTSDFQEIVGIEAFVNRFGADRLLFGTNYPMDNMGGSKATLLGARISVKDKENIASGNFYRLCNRRGGFKT